MAVENLQQFEGKQITLVRLLEKPNEDGHEVEELTGRAEKARDGVGVVLKPKGRSGVILIEPDEIDNISIIEPASRKLKGRRVDPVTDDKVKQHLIDRHGHTLSHVNAATVAQAVETHNRINHSDLGHFHKEKAETEREAAIAEAAAKSA